MWDIPSIAGFKDKDGAARLGRSGDLIRRPSTVDRTEVSRAIGRIVNDVRYASCEYILPMMHSDQAMRVASSCLSCTKRYAECGRCEGGIRVAASLSTLSFSNYIHTSSTSWTNPCRSSSEQHGGGGVGRAQRVKSAMGYFLASLYPRLLLYYGQSATLTPNLHSPRECLKTLFDGNRQTCSSGHCIFAKAQALRMPFQPRLCSRALGRIEQSHSNI